MNEMQNKVTHLRLLNSQTSIPSLLANASTQNKDEQTING